MAITIDWATKIISVPKADMTLVQTLPSEIRELDINTFRLALKDLEDDEEGMPFIRTHNNNAPVTVGGVALARVVEIINGYTVTFEDGVYAVNLSGANSNIGDVVNLNNVSIRSANSAGLTYSKEMEDLSYSDSRVWINTDGSITGTTYPLGTPSYPVNNLSDALDIIAGRTLPPRLQLHGAVVSDATHSLAEHDVIGCAPLLSTVTFLPGANTYDFHGGGLTLTGALDGEISVHDTLLASISGFQGRLVEGSIIGTITLAGTGLQTPHVFKNCTTVATATSTPSIDMDDLADCHLVIRNYTGRLELLNITDADSTADVDFNSGELVIDSSCTDGTITVRGVGVLTDNSGAGCTVDSEGLLNPVEVNSKLDNNFSISAAGV